MASKNATDVGIADLDKELLTLLDQQREIKKRIEDLNRQKMVRQKPPQDKIDRAIMLCKESEREDGVNTLRSYIDRIQSILEAV